MSDRKLSKHFLTFHLVSFGCSLIALCFSDIVAPRTTHSIPTETQHHQEGGCRKVLATSAKQVASSTGPAASAHSKTSMFTGFEGWPSFNLFARSCSWHNFSTSLECRCWSLKSRSAVLAQSFSTYTKASGAGHWADRALLRHFSLRTTTQAFTLL